MNNLKRYNVVWDSPSQDASGSMPLGNGDLGLNVWVEEGGDLLLLIGKTDAWDENSINLKLGRVRMALSPNPFVHGASFQQRLMLGAGTIEIFAGPSGGLIGIRIWADANDPVIRVEIVGAKTELTATLETWRNAPYTVKTQTGDLFKNLTGPDPFPTVLSPDLILPAQNNRILWCHHNTSRDDDGYAINLKLQGLGDMIGQMPHPLLARTFGAAMAGEKLTAADDRTLKSQGPRRGHRLSIYPLTLHPATIEQWQTALERSVERIDAIDREVAREKHFGWWRDFWNRSWIEITSDSPEESEKAFHVTQAYLLQRFMNACAGRGASPIKFNGSIFTVGKPDDPDFRRWGGPGFWFQNQRLIYWPMLADGDFDLMRPWLKMYRQMLPLQRHRTRTYYSHGGAHYPETITFWGAEVSAHYGWTPFEQRQRPEAECSYVTYYWQGGIELTLILLNYFAHTQDRQLAEEMLLPIADAVTEFYDLHYPRGADGKIRFEPAESLETWHEAINPLPEIAGLRNTLPKLLKMPEELTTDVMRRRWARMLEELPAIPVGEKDGKRVILPAERFDKMKNTENPELYCIFPYRLFGVGKPDLQLARDTFAARLHPSHDCWSQDDVQMAMLGLTQQAKDYLTQRASPASHKESRFPAFWDAFHDWVPDMDHGGVLQLAVQSMLMQTDGKKILLLPAWPREWNADFRLHAPEQTMVKAKVRRGELVDLEVTPRSRAGDVEVCLVSGQTK